VLTWFFSSILITVVAAFMRVAFWFVDESQGLVRKRQRTEEQMARSMSDSGREPAHLPRTGLMSGAPLQTRRTE